MILSAQSLRRRSGIIFPFHERTVLNGMTFGLSPAGYDIRIAQSIVIPHHGFYLASSIERFDMPADILARVADKSSWARRGICVQNTVIEPGWRGYLTLEITNHSLSPVEIECGSPIAQIIFEQLDEPTDLPYSGKYQDQPSCPIGVLYDQGGVDVSA